MHQQRKRDAELDESDSEGDLFNPETDQTTSLSRHIRKKLLLLRRDHFYTPLHTLSNH
jgi:hypothetical protein